ncbi:MAG: hypothetical protein HRT35_28805, partial [Algicola sp.]|nr:hypothetical protein [Algicola sp.]
MQFVQHFKLLALAVATSFSTQADEYQLTPYTSFTAHGNHVTEVVLPDEGFTAEKVLLEVELGCAEIGCSDWDYTVRYEWQVGDDKFELGRLITPYAGYMQRGMHGFDRSWRRKYVFDVTHLTPVLKQKGRLVAHYGGWGAKKSAFGFAAKLITQGSEPLREVKRVINLYRSGSEGWPYKTAASFGEYLKPQVVEFAPDETYAEVKVTVSAHGHALSFDNPKNEP